MLKYYFLNIMPLPKIISKLSKDSTKTVYVDSIDIPVGTAIAAADDDYLYIVLFEDSKSYYKSFEALAKELSCKFVEKQNRILQKLEDELVAYFKGNLKKFTVPLKLVGSSFQQDVWNQLLKMPFGTTQSYGDLAKDLGRPASHSRAVGSACGANPLLILVPCHRLVASGTIGGFSSGLDRKGKLLELEKKYS